MKKKYYSKLVGRNFSTLSREEVRRLGANKNLQVTSQGTVYRTKTDAQKREEEAWLNRHEKRQQQQKMARNKQIVNNLLNFGSGKRQMFGSFKIPKMRFGGF